MVEPSQEDHLILASPWWLWQTGNVLEASEFHKKHHVKRKKFKRGFFCHVATSKEKKNGEMPYLSFHNQTPLSERSNPKGTQRNGIWQMGVFHMCAIMVSLLKIKCP